MGIIIEGSNEQLTAKNQTAWAEAYSKAADLANRRGIKHSVYGSFSHGLLADVNNRPHDLDFLLMCPQEDRESFAADISQQWSPNLPTLDLSEIFFYFNTVNFDSEGNAALVKKDLKIPVDSSVFKTYDTSFEQDAVKTLHPQTYRELLRHSLLNPKVQRGIDTIEQAIAKGVGEEHPTPNFESFEVYLQELNKSWTWRQLKSLNEKEAAGSRHPLVIAKRTFTACFPNGTKQIRGLLHGK